MKIALLLLVLIGFVASSHVQHSDPFIDDVVASFLEGLSTTGSLRNAVNLPYAVELDRAEDDIKTELGKLLKEKLDETLEKIKEQVEKGKDVAKELLEKVKDIKFKLKELGLDAKDKLKDYIGKLKEKTKEALKKLLEKFGISKRSLDQEMDIVARSKFSEFVEKIKNKILENETLRKIRDYIRNFVTTNPTIQKIKEFLLRLRDVDFREIVKSIFEHKHIEQRSLKESWEKVKDFFKNLKESLRDKTKAFRDYIKQTWNEGLAKLKEKHGLIKALAMDIISHGKDISKEIADEALEFFRPYKDDLGALWNQIVEVVKQARGKF